MTLQDRLRQYGLRPGAGEPAITEAERRLGRTLPDDYREILRHANGLEGRIGDRHVELWPVEELAQLNGDYEVPRWRPDAVGIGTDGGGYLLDYARSGAPVVATVPLGDLSSDSVVEVAPTVTKLLGL